MIQALLFDLDGVIIDSEPLHERAKRKAFAQFGLAVPDSDFDGFVGKTDWDVIAYAVETYGNGTSTIETVLAHKQQAFRDLMPELEPIPGVLPFIRQAAGRFRLALTTSATRVNQQLAFDKFGLDAFFEVVVTAADITRAKPDPQPYALTVERLGLAPEACLVIEDSVNGVRSAVGAGCRVAALTTSFESAALVEAGAEVVVADYEALARWIEAA